jgi:hypothetical protein
MMTRKIRYALAAFALIFGGAAVPSNAGTIFFLGELTDDALLGAFHTGPGNFVDEYRFTLANAGNIFGDVTLTDGTNRGIVLNGITLLADGKGIGSDDGAFAFSGLLTDVTYSLLVDGDVFLKNTNPGGFFPGYFGKLKFEATTTTPAPEPSTFVLAGVGLLAFGVAMRRRLFG